MQTVVDRAAAQRLVVRNTLYLTLSQVLAMPLSIFTTAIGAQYLGPEAFGQAYLATTLCLFGFLAVQWGHEAVLPAVISRDHSLAGTMLASSLVWREVVSIPVYLVLAFSCSDSVDHIAMITVNNTGGRVQAQYYR